ncbi:glycosyltransferase [Sphingopyxis sp. BSN-002]|uniref:glycosyltransferase n=1 Tax=Sphingopyxis sp. BSN-002 TaxID=2911495 RepID=UPI001EDAEC07|nr:glycosyltransferase [Sphingopyxis sp. BSN-002]UKK85252.1 glycosyltransferase [Sphingopyxis sp. BSN-002]
MTTSLPRVLHVITGLDTGGAERSLFNLLQSGLRHRFDNHVVSLSGPGHYGPLLRDLGISVHALGMREGTGPVGALSRLRMLVREIAPGIVQGWMYHGNLAASAAAWGQSPKPAVSWNIRQSLDAIGLEKRGTRWTINALKPLSRAPRAIIYNSYRACEQHEAHGYSGARSLVIPNGFDTQKWWPDPARRAEWREKLGLTADEVALGYIGRFHPMKDIPTFLDACDRALGVNPDLRVVMVGEALDGNNPEIVDAIAPEKRARFRLLGRRPDVETILPAFDLFCLASSRNEGFPNVLGEAMASGLPCVATDVGDSARLMNGLGRVVPPGDAAQMAEAIGEIAAMDLARRSEMGEAARDRIVATYGLDATVEAYAGLYDSMLKRDV